MKEKEFLPLLSSRLGIDELNPMQRRMLDLSAERRDFILLSPTGSGKTVAFTIPMLKWLKPASGRLQAVVIAPSRELVQQIHGVIRSLAPGYKVGAVYGGHNVEDEVNSLAAGVDILVATPGRLLDHIRRRNIDVLPTRIVVLDEFDKSLELGFEEDMRKIIGRMKNLSRYVLTSATRADVLPEFLNLNNPLEVDFLDHSSEVNDRMAVHRFDSDSNDKLESLLSLLHQLSSEKGLAKTIVFVNHRESAERTAEFLRKKGVDAVLYHGQLDQQQRETAIALFNNGSRPILVATDLAARGLDIEGVQNIIHYHQPLTPETYTHRNGRTARVAASGDIYVLVGPEEKVKDFIEFDDTVPSKEAPQGAKLRSGLSTLYISDGKKEKVSKGDILGFLTKDCGLEASQVGKINVFDHYALVAVDSAVAKKVISDAAVKRLKGRKRRISLLQ